MKKLLILFSLFFFEKAFSQAVSNPAKGKYVLVIHGGAGTIQKSMMTPEKEKAYTAALNTALETGEAILRKGGTALDAVEATVRSLEDNPLFNAGKGAVFTNEGKNELDAAIMDGQTLEAGSVAGVTIIRNPISAARAVMERSEHVMMTGKGAEEFARLQGLDIVDPSYFYTEERWKGLQLAKQTDSIAQANLLRQIQDINSQLENANSRVKVSLQETDSLVKLLSGDSSVKYGKDVLHKIDSLKKLILKDSGGRVKAINHDHKFGTVGAVALDQQGNLAAATSTGGMTNKRFGRVGDAPVIGAGTYANNKTVAISCTGWGEYFIRLVMAKTISDMMEFGKMDLKKASDEMVLKRLPALGGDGGLIAVDKNGNIALPFFSEGMYRGWVKQGGQKMVKIYKE